MSALTDEDDFWSSSSVSNTLISSNINNDNNSSNDNNDNNSNNDNIITVNYVIKKFVLPNLGYSNIDNSFYFKFNNIQNDINGCKIDRIINIQLSQIYNINIDEIMLKVIPLKIQYNCGLIIEIKYLNSIHISDEVLSHYGKKIESFILELPLEEELNKIFGIQKVKKEEYEFTVYRKKNK
jgi:hypothetical protein